MQFVVTCVILRLGGMLIVNVFYSALFFHWSTINFPHGMKATLFLKEGEFVLHAIVVHSKVLQLWMYVFWLCISHNHGIYFWQLLVVIFFILGRWRWKFAYMRKIWGISPSKTYCHESLSLKKKSSWPRHSWKNNYCQGDICTLVKPMKNLEEQLRR
jgi:hypothetical protein